MVDRPKGPIAPWMAERMRMPPGSLLGTADVAELLGVTRQRVSQLRTDPTFPRTGVGYGRVGLWHRAGIECWAAAHRPARSEAAGRFMGECGRLLRAAEHEGARLNIHWIDTGLFWLTVSGGDLGRPLRDALESVGMTTAEIEAQLVRMRPSDDRPRRTRRLNPLTQTLLAAADRAVAEDQRDRVRTLDILLAFIDAKPVKVAGLRARHVDHILSAFERRGLDLAELRRRLIDADADASAVARFDHRALRPWRDRLRKKPDWLDLAPNPLGHDPWTRRPWGTVFARTLDERGLKIEGEQWFFSIDGDGYFVRATDGRPIGYRYRVEPKPRLRPVNGFMEILPMPDVELADWPDHRYGIED